MELLGSVMKRHPYLRKWAIVTAQSRRHGHFVNHSRLLALHVYGNLQMFR